MTENIAEMESKTEQGPPLGDKPSLPEALEQEVKQNLPNQQVSPKEIPKSFEPRLNALMEGKVPPKNEMSKYFLDHFGEVLQEARMVEQAINKMSAELEAAKVRRMELKGMHTATLSGLYEWDQIRQVDE